MPAIYCIIIGIVLRYFLQEEIFVMKNSNKGKAATKIEKLAKGKNVLWVFENGKIILRFIINFENINYDHIMMAAFEYKKRVASAGNSEYMIEFECEENDLDAVFHSAEDLCKKIMEEARNIPDYENRYELKNDLCFGDEKR